MGAWETLVTAWLVFFACSSVVAVVTGVLLWTLIEKARSGDDQARIMLAILGLAAVVVGLAWSTSVIFR